jgi:hypothetical protein
MVLSDIDLEPSSERRQPSCGWTLTACPRGFFDALGPVGEVSLDIASRRTGWDTHEPCRSQIARDRPPQHHLPKFRHRTKKSWTGAGFSTPDPHKALINPPIQIGTPDAHSFSYGSRDLRRHALRKTSAAHGR